MTDTAEFWKKELTAAEKRQEDFWKAGGKIDERFKDERSGENITERNYGDDIAFRLNLFHANVETQISMLFGRIPKTDVSRRFADPNDDLARIASELLQRQLNTSIQAPGSNDSDIFRACLQDRLIPGLGIARVRYVFETITMQERIAEKDENGETIVREVDNPQISDEQVPIEYVYWKDFRWGFGRIWSQVKWVSFDTYLDKKEAEERFGEEVVKKLEFKIKPISEDGDTDNSKSDPRNRAKITEIWHKPTRQVHWYSKDCTELLDTKDDPLGLTGFFPCPEPLTTNCTSKMYLPTADFKIAQDLYNYIDTVQTRISIITRAVKVTGVYDASSQEIKRMFDEGNDNELIPVSNWAMFAEKQGLKGQVDWLPLEEIVGALTKLQELRNEAIQLLYEITGMSDIIRGHSEQYTGVGQDQIKAKFASVRMQHVQDDFARFISDLMRLRAEIITKHFEPQTIFIQSSAKYLMEEPNMIQQAVGLLKSEQENWMWQVEVKPENVALLDYGQIKSERVEFLTAMSQFLSSVTGGNMPPVVMPFLLELMRWGLAGFKGSQQIEGVLDKAIKAVMEQMKQPQQQPPNPKIEELKLKHQLEMAKQKQKVQAEIAKITAKYEADSKQLQLEHQQDVKLEQVQSNASITEMQLDHAQDVELEQVQSGANISEMQLEHNQDMTLEEAQAVLNVAEIQKKLEADLKLERLKQSGTNNNSKE